MLRFRIGLVTKHKKYNYKCVINGWDDHCAAPQVSQAKRDSSAYLDPSDTIFTSLLIQQFVLLEHIYLWTRASSAPLTINYLEFDDQPASFAPVLRIREF